MGSGSAKMSQETTPVEPGKGAMGFLDPFHGGFADDPNLHHLEFPRSHRLGIEGESRALPERSGGKIDRDHHLGPELNRAR